MRELSEEYFDKKFESLKDGLNQNIDKKFSEMYGTMTSHHLYVVKQLQEQSDIVLQHTGDIREIKKKIIDLQSARSFWIRCSVGFASVVTFLILLWKILSER
jgi:hypothetical protein